MRNYWFCFLSAICLVGFGLLQQCGRSNAVYSAIGKQSLVMVAPTPLCQPIDNSSQQPSRHEFAKKMASLEEGMQASEVVKILGQPDDIKTQNDPGGINTYKTKEIWRYGTNGHLTFPTLGQVYINKNDQVQYLLGNEGTPTTLFSEEALRCIVRTLSEVPTYGRSRFNPRPLIRAVNTLQPLGKEKALAAISEYLRITAGIFDESRGGIFFVLRLLFEIPTDTGYMPKMRIGEWSPSPPKDPKVFPLYPLVLSGDIPFDLSNGYSLGGFPEQPESHVEYFKKNGVLRKRLLYPTNQPWQAMEQVVKNPENFSLPHLPLAAQVARLLDSVYEIQDDEKSSYRSELTYDQYAHARTNIPLLSLRWDERFNGYTFTNGLIYSTNPQPVHRREIWRPDAKNPEFEIIFERETKHSLSIVVTRSHSEDDEWDNGQVQVYDKALPEKTLEKFDLKKVEANSGWSSSSTIKFEAGNSLEFELKGQRRIIKSPVYSP